MKNRTSILLYALLLSTGLLHCMEDKKKQCDTNTKDGIYSYDPMYKEELIKIAIDNKARLLSLESTDEESNIRDCISQVTGELVKDANIDQQSKIYLKDGKVIGFINYRIEPNPWYTDFKELDAPSYLYHLQKNHVYRGASFFEAAPKAYISHLAIDEKYRGKGYGAALLENALNDCKDKGVSKITLKTTDWSDHRLDHFYKSFGFDTVGGCHKSNGYTQKYALRFKPHPLTRKLQKLLTWLARRK